MSGKDKFEIKTSDLLDKRAKAIAERLDAIYAVLIEIQQDLKK